MYKTVWLITYEHEDWTYRKELTLYHFKEYPRFPAWYLKEDYNYMVQRVDNVKIMNSLQNLMRCLVRLWIVK